jgi:hypothetical protein
MGGHHAPHITPDVRPGHAAMRTQRERAEERRNLRLQDVERQVESGSLVIRSMTKEERKRFPAPDPARPPRKRRWA